MNIAERDADARHEDDHARVLLDHMAGRGAGERRP
jgi:hypothetical protein